MSAPAARDPQASITGPATLRQDAWALLLLAGVISAAVWIVGSSRFLPMYDASNHVAAGAIASALLRGDPFFSSYYQFLPVPVPYWMTTIAIVVLEPVLGPLRAFNVTVCLFVAALPLSFYLLLRTAARANVGLAAIAGLLAFSDAYWTGESNFLFGQPLAILALALFLRLSRDRAVTLLGFLVVVVGCYLCHIYSLAVVVGGVLGLGVLSLVGARLGGSWEAYRFRRLQWMGAALLLGTFLGACYFVFLQHGRDSYLGGLRFDLSPRRVAAAVVGAAFATPDAHSGTVLRVLLVAIGGFLVAPLLAGLRPGGARPRLNPQMAVLTLVLVAATWLGPVAVLSPDGSVGEGDISNRFGIFAFLLALGVVPLGPRRSVRVALTLMIAVLAVLRLGEVREVHLKNDAAVRELEAALLAKIPAQSRVVGIRDFEGSTDWDKILGGFVNYVAVERHGYSPHVFDVPGQQPLRHRLIAAYRKFPGRHLTDSDLRFFDYVVVQKSRDQPGIPELEERGEQVAAAAGFYLYRVKPDPSPASLPAS